jgi:putative colanic acid biosynthesis UDP-glucose lipid carrier transferase
MSEISIAAPSPLGSVTPLSGANDALEQKVRIAQSLQEPLLSSPSIAHTAFRLGTTEPPSIALIREMVGPGVAVLSLAVCLWAADVRFTLETLALGVVVFLLSQRVLSTPDYQARPDGRRELHPTLPRLLLEWGCVFAVMLFLTSALGLIPVVGARALTAWLLLTPAALVASNSATMRLTRWWSTHRPAACRHIIIGATQAGLELAKRVKQGSYSGQFLGFFDFRERDRLPNLAPEQWAGTCREVADFVRRNAVDAIYIALPISTAPRIAELLKKLRDTTASIYFVPANIFEFDLVQPRCVEIHGIPALAVCETPHLGMSGLRKRAMDVLLAILAVVFAGPLMLAIAALVKLTSPGPALFKQRRYGLNGEEMFVYKFRSMTVCEDGPSVTQATRNDHRFTRIGQILRRTSLDELPQILNVLQGKMSFVGPRPHAVAHNELYRKLISGYMTRHKVRPGITGWAQVNGLRGETETLDKMRRRIEFDIDYMNHWSIWLDLKILFRTLLIVLRDQHAY